MVSAALTSAARRARPFAAGDGRPRKYLHSTDGRSVSDEDWIMSNEEKKALRITVDAHEKLKEYCERTGRTQVEVLSELTYRFIKPELDRLLEEEK